MPYWHRGGPTRKGEYKDVLKTQGTHRAQCSSTVFGAQPTRVEKRVGDREKEPQPGRNITKGGTS